MANTTEPVDLTEPFDESTKTFYRRLFEKWRLKDSGQLPVVAAGAWREVGTVYRTLFARRINRVFAVDLGRWLGNRP